MKIYVAGKYEEKKAVREVISAVEQAGHEITLDWTNDPSEGVDAAIADLQAVEKADALIIIPHPRSKGAYTELGAALALRKQVFILQKEPLTEDQCVFLFHPLAMQVISLPALLNVLAL